MRVNNSTICVIPARRGSKRVKLKNILPINGKPVIAYTIIEAIKTKLFDKVYVATEDKEIADISRKYGAIVPLLMPKKICGDHTASWVPCDYLIKYLAKTEGAEYENLLCLQPTSVLKKSVDIIEGMKVFLKNKNDFLVSVTSIDPHYFHWAMMKDENSWRMYFRDRYLKDRHELPQVYRPNGAIKIANIEKLRKYGHFFGKNLGVIFMPEERAIHIASQLDIELADLLLKKDEIR